jgi:hypothetical protein
MKLMKSLNKIENNLDKESGSSKSGSHGSPDEKRRTRSVSRHHDGEHEKDGDAKTWLMGMGKYFKLHNYSSHVEGRIAIYQLKGNTSMWWDQLVQVQHIKEKSVTWREFKKYFEKKYLSKRYYDKKMKEFFEIKLGSMTIDEYEIRFLELLKYVSFIKDETVKIQRYLSGLLAFINEKIQYGDPKTLEDT